jgi:hypothetical protein
MGKECGRKARSNIKVRWDKKKGKKDEDGK